jgi:hypothetical protein
MIPGWKFKRELKRLKVQANAIPLALYEPFLQRRYDQTRSQRIKCTNGNLPASDTLAIFLIYQPDGVAKSVFDTCNHLIASGYSPIIVSNTPLSNVDRVTLQSIAHIIIERPNFGYDFGGYRDGLWLVSELALNPQQIIFLNDSVWFPTLSTSTLLKEFSAANVDYFGAQIFMNPAGGNKSQALFGSYCFAVNAPLLNNSAFVNFWDNYKLSSNKEMTLRRGERAFSYQMMKSAKNSYGVYSLDRFNSVVDGLNPDGLQEALEDMIALDPHLESQRLQLLATKKSLSWVDQTKNLIKEGAKTKNYIGSSPILSIREMGFPMIKKNNERLYTLARKRIVLAAEEGRLECLLPTVLIELKEKVASTEPTNQPEKG